MRPVIILGLGNTLMSDEGIGVKVAQALQHGGCVPDHVEVLDLGSGGLRVLHHIKDRAKAVFVDCAFMNEEPGVWRRFSPDEARSTKVQTGLSLHEGDVLQAIELSRLLGECPDEVIIIGVQPEVVTPGEALSPVLAARLEEYRDVVLSEVGGMHRA